MPRGAWDAREDSATHANDTDVLCVLALGVLATARAAKAQVQLGSTLAYVLVFFPVRRAPSIR